MVAGILPYRSCGTPHLKIPELGSSQNMASAREVQLYTRSEAHERLVRFPKPTGGDTALHLQHDVCAESAAEYLQ